MQKGITMNYKKHANYISKAQLIIDKYQRCCPECGTKLVFSEASFYCPACGFCQSDSVLEVNEN